MLSEAQKDTYKAFSLEEKANYELKCEKARRLYQQTNGTAAAPEKSKAAPKQVEKKVTKNHSESSDSLSSVQSDNDASTHITLFNNPN